MVLGFSLLADDPSDGDTREAFRGSQHVLHTLGRLSAQAAQYHQILSAFSEAIDVYRRQKRSEQRNESRVPFVEQILSYDEDHYHNQHNHEVSTTMMTTITSSSFSGVSGNHNYMIMKRTENVGGGGGGDGDDDGEDGDGVFDQFILTRENMGNNHIMCANVDVLGQQDRALLQEMEGPQSSGTSLQQQQLPTPDFNDVDEPLSNGRGAAAAAGGGGGGYWNGSDSLSSMSMLSDFLPENWPPAADNELMLRLLWDGYAMSFDDPALVHPQDGERNIN